MKIPDKITISVDCKYKIGLWDAIKLRIAGKNYQVVAREIIKKLESRK